MNLPAPISGSDLRAARSADREPIAELLTTVGLPTSELDTQITNFLVAYWQGRLAGCVGMEWYGRVAFLRSLAVRPEYQGFGLGRRLAVAILAEAERLGASEAVLLTHSAVKLAQSLGFVEMTRDTLPTLMLESWEFRSDCCRKAHCMRMSLHT